MGKTTMYGKPMSRADIIKQNRENAAYVYLNRVGAYNRTKCQLKGSTLTFKYNFQTPAGIKTFERIVNVDTGVFRDRPCKSNTRTGIMLNVCTGAFMPY